MADVEIPCYFLCPISLQIMRDPVTLSTGITYDRGSIERWIFAGKHSTCPVTNQLLSTSDLTPNHTLRRLIQAWCTVNASRGVERLPTPRAPLDQAHIANLLDRGRSPQLRLSSLQQLKTLVFDSESNRRCVGSNSSAVDFLASVIIDDCDKCRSSSDEALSILSSLELPEPALVQIVARNDDFIDSLTSMLKLSGNASRTNAIVLLNAIVKVIAPARLSSVTAEVFDEMLRLLDDKISAQATKAALEALFGLCQWGRNRIKAVSSGTVRVLVDTLIDEQEDRRINEMVLVVLDKLCGCAEGRAEFVGHEAGIAAVSNKILRVSSLGSERAVRILYSVARYSATAAVLQEMVQVGVVAKLCMMLLAGGGAKGKVRAREILGMHARVWRSSPCLSPQLQAVYPC